MYGLVNKAIEDLVCTQFGWDTWQTIKRRAGIDLPVFLCMQQYPDDLTYKLVNAASETLDMPPAAILHAFGTYWTQYTAQEGYGELLGMTGDTFQEFLLNLDTMHARVAFSYPHLQPPSFECTDMTSTSLNLHYFSSRQGLAPMVVGLLEGLAALFNLKIEIVLTHSREAGNDHEIFALTFQES